MEGQNLTKVILKIRDPQSNTHKWIHLCYIPQALFEEYRKATQQGFTNLNETLARWAKEDFNEELSVETAAELDKLKTLVKQHYKQLYSEIYLEQTTDRQGWLRVWITKKIREELKLDGKQSK